MKDLIIKYRSVIKFILTFLLVYAVLSFIYKFYLDASLGTKFYPDYVTNVVALQTKSVLNTVGYKSIVVPHPDEPSMKLLINGNYLARVIEGCNSISVIILFISFVVAFSGTLKITLFFILTGGIIIYCVNLFRIVILSIGLYHYPDKSELLHSVVFPVIIYGMVFLLWMVWVNRFSNVGKKNAKL